MSLEHLLRTRQILLLTLLTLCFIILLLGVALVIKCFQPREIVVVPNAQKEMTLKPEEVPEEAVRAFAMLYVTRLDNYTPATVSTLFERLSALVAPEFWSQATDALEKRKRLSIEGRISSQVILGAPEEVRLETGEEWRVTVPAHRRTFVADTLSSGGEMEYVLDLTILLPTAGNPFGLAVVGQSIKEFSDDAP